MKPSKNLSSRARLSEVFPPESIRVGLEQHSKSSVNIELVHHAAALGYLARQEEGPIVTAILEREDLGSTALGHGIALPHCQCRSLERSVGVVGLLRRGIPFDAADGEPVDKVFLTLVPAKSPNHSLDVLGRLVALGQNKGLRLLLGGCQTAAHVTAFLDELDQPFVGRIDELARRSLTWLERDRLEPRSELAVFGLVQEETRQRDREIKRSSNPRWL